MDSRWIDVLVRCRHSKWEVVPHKILVYVAPWWLNVMEYVFAVWSQPALCQYKQDICIFSTIGPHWSSLSPHILPRDHKILHPDIPEVGSLFVSVLYLVQLPPLLRGIAPHSRGGIPLDLLSSVVLLSFCHCSQIWYTLFAVVHLSESFWCLLLASIVLRKSTHGYDKPWSVDSLGRRCTQSYFVCRTFWGRLLTHTLPHLT